MPVLNRLFIFTGLYIAFIIRRFELVWCLIGQSFVGAFCVVIINIIVYIFVKFLFRTGVYSVEFLFLECREEGLCYGIIMGVTGTRERLFYIIYIQQITKSFRGVLGSLITMKQQLFGVISFCKSLFKCDGNQSGIDLCFEIVYILCIEG